MTVTLSPRLAAVAAFVLPRLTLADVGTDHAYLPIALVAAGAVPNAVATDIAAKPLAAARRSVADAGLTASVAVRCGAGLAVLTPGEAATIVIAGMGGYLIRDIIAASPDVARTAQRLVLQPMRDAVALRRWLWVSGWSLGAERMAREGNRYYTIIVAELGKGIDAGGAARLAQQAGISEELVSELGPLVISGPDPLLSDWIERELRQIEGLDAEIAGASGSAPSRRAALATRQQELQSLRVWLRGHPTISPET